MRPQTIFLLVLLIIGVLAIISVYPTNHHGVNTYYLLVYCKSNDTSKIVMVMRFNSPSVANLSFTHSVHKTPIYDIILVNSTGFYGIQHWTKAFGAGEPDTAEDAGASSWIYNPKTGFYIFTGMNRPLGRKLYLPIDISYNMSITILYNGIPVKLDSKTCNHTLEIVDYGVAS
jgi:hypothetical protein